ncbi:MAG: NusG domain II-containing protein [Candidatus Borkfalkia sp.]
MSEPLNICRGRHNSFFAFGDLAVYAVLLALVLLFTVFSFSGRKEEGTRLEISYRGEVIFTAGLEKDALYVFYIDGGKGKVIAGGDADGLSDYNVIEVKDGKASVVASDCADKVCFGNGVCLPHMTFGDRLRRWGRICEAHGKAAAGAVLLPRRSYCFWWKA